MEAGPPSLWSGFYKKPLRERQNQLRLMFPNLFRTAPPDGGAPERGDGAETGGAAAAKSTSPLRSPRKPGGAGGELDDAFPIRGLDDAVADNMIENCIGTVGLPVGLGLHLVMNGTPYVVPMAVEEPSIIAAVSNAARTLAGALGGGFVARHSPANVMIAQLQVLDVADVEAAAVAVRAHRDELVELGNRFCPSMVERGGGVRGVEARRIDPRPPRLPKGAQARPVAVQPYVVVHILVDVCEAMGANVVNTVAEGIAPRVAAITGGRIGLRILSNLAVHRVAQVRRPHCRGVATCAR